jgi:hypothetical protein
LDTKKCAGYALFNKTIFLFKNPCPIVRQRNRPGMYPFKIPLLNIESSRKFQIKEEMSYHRPD